MTIALSASQESNTIVGLRWTSTDPDPTAGFEISREVNPPDTPKVLGTVIGDSRLFVDDLAADGLAVGDVLEYTIEDLDTTETGTATIGLADLDVPYTYAPVDSGITVPRYTTLEAVKTVLGIAPSSTAKDERITQSIVAVELAIDMELGNRFPSSGSNPRWPYVPVSISELAQDGAVGAYTASNSPHGTAGSDEWLGSLSIADTVSRTVRRNPLLRGYQISFGFG